MHKLRADWNTHQHMAIALCRHAVFWKQYLRQTATIYKEHNELQAKDFSFKVQELRVKSKGDERKTIGKVHVDLAQFCTEHADGQQQEVFLQLK